MLKIYHTKGIKLFSFLGIKTEVFIKRLLQAQQAQKAQQTQQKQHELHITEKEKQFLQLACSDMTYKHIASLMGVSERTVDAYREALFEKLHVQSRVGLCLEALRNEMVKL